MWVRLWGKHTVSLIAAENTPNELKNSERLRTNLDSDRINQETGSSNTSFGAEIDARDPHELMPLVRAML